MCAVCDHTDRIKIEARLDAKDPIKTIAREHQLPPSSLKEHARKNHKETRPHKPVDPSKTKIEISLPPSSPENQAPRWPTNDEIAAIEKTHERIAICYRALAERRYKGPKTIALFAHLWRKSLAKESKDPAEMTVALYFARAAERHARYRGTREFKREVLIIRAEEVHDLAKREGKPDAALNCLKFIAELDGITYEPGMLSALVEAQTWRLVQPLLQQKYPQAMKEIAAVMASADNKRSKAKKLLNEGPTFAEVVSEGGEESRALGEGETEECVVIDDNAGSKDEETPGETRAEEGREEG